MQMPKYDNATIEKLDDMAYQIKVLATRAMDKGHVGHPGGSFSEAEIIAALYFHEMQIDPSIPKWDKRDRFILSKAHSCPSLYAALALRGFFPVEECLTYGSINSRLQGHPDMRKTPGIEISGGSLGQGLSVACGMAWGLKKMENFSHVYCLIGDGESQEGQIWEAAMSASQYKLDNLTLIMDYNKVQAKAFTYDEIGIEPVTKRWESFGWQTIEIDGHDMEEILNALYKARWINRTGRPTIIIAHTVKGKGVDFMEFNSRWHTHAPTGEKAKETLEKLTESYEKKSGKGGSKLWK
jgi:transketolase